MCDPIAGCQYTTVDCYCGNGSLEQGEECDDGNRLSGDGCSSRCTREPPCHTVLDTSDVDALEARIDQAIRDTIATLNASGIVFDWTNIDHRQMLFDRLPVELGCF